MFADSFFQKHVGVNLLSHVSYLFWCLWVVGPHIAILSLLQELWLHWGAWSECGMSWGVFGGFCKKSFFWGLSISLLCLIYSPLKSHPLDFMSFPWTGEVFCQELCLCTLQTSLPLFIQDTLSPLTFIPVYFTLVSSNLLSLPMSIFHVKKKIFNVLYFLSCTEACTDLFKAHRHVQFWWFMHKLIFLIKYVVTQNVLLCLKRLSLPDAHHVSGTEIPSTFEIISL